MRCPSGSFLALQCTLAVAWCRSTTSAQSRSELKPSASEKDANNISTDCLTHHWTASWRDKSNREDARTGSESPFKRFTNRWLCNFRFCWHQFALLFGQAQHPNRSAAPTGSLDWPPLQVATIELVRPNASVLVQLFLGWDAASVDERV